MTEPEFRKGGLSPAGKVLGEVLSRLGLERRWKEHNLLSKWASVVGTQVAAATRTEGIRDGVLIVLCKSSAWANELSLYKDQIVARLNAIAGEQLVRDIRFSTRGYRAMAGGDTNPGQEVPAQAPISEEDVECARRIASICKDPELGKIVERAILTAKRYRRRALESGCEKEVEKNG